MSTEIFNVPPGGITTCVGTGTAGFGGDGGPAIAAQLNTPDGLVVGAGSLYIADRLNNRVRKVDLGTGIITTFAGTGTAGFGGDGGPAIAAQLNGPAAMAVDAGSLYVTDFFNNRVRKVDLGTGIITTFAGTGTAGFGGDGGPAIAASLSAPEGVVIWAGSLYITDQGNNRVRRVDLATGIITTFAGTGTVGFGGDGGPAIAAQLNTPRGMAVDEEGNVYFACWHNNRVRKVKPVAPPAVYTLAQVDGAIPLPLSAGVTVSSAFTVSADRVVPAGKPVTVTFPTGLSLPADGQVRYICPADGTNIPLFTNTTGAALSSVTFPAQEITGSTACFYSMNIQASGAVTGPLYANISVAGTTGVLAYKVSALTATVAQTPPDPVVLSPGDYGSLGFTVSADTVSPAGEPVTVTFPAGVSMQPEGAVVYICSGVSTPVYTNTTGTYQPVVTFPAQEITGSTACFYSVNIQATGNPTGPAQGNISVAGTTHPINITTS
ncbi:hypothetical protein ACWCZ5_32700 [Streptomyces sp. NPDC001667]